MKKISIIAVLLLTVSFTYAQLNLGVKVGYNSSLGINDLGSVTSGTYNLNSVKSDVANGFEVGGFPLHRPGGRGGEITWSGKDDPFIRLRRKLDEGRQQPIIGRVPQLNGSIVAGRRELRDPGIGGQGIHPVAVSAEQY